MSNLPSVPLIIVTAAEHNGYSDFTPPNTPVAGGELLAFQAAEGEEAILFYCFHDGKEVELFDAVAPYTAAKAPAMMQYRVREQAASGLYVISRSSDPPIALTKGKNGSITVSSPGPRPPPRSRPSFLPTRCR